jgi:hypothetical protein
VSMSRGGSDALVHSKLRIYSGRDALVRDSHATSDFELLRIVLDAVRGLIVDKRAANTSDNLTAPGAERFKSTAIRSVLCSERLSSNSLSCKCR